MPDRSARASRARSGSPPDPLLLLPLRIEYRVVKEGVLLPSARVVPSTRVIAGSGISPAGTPSRVRLTRRTQRRTEIWFRWYPDEAFSEQGVVPPTAEESRSLAAFQEVVQAHGREWHDLSDPALADAWERLVGELGFARALHLQRAQGVPPAADWEDRVGRIVGLPGAFELFAIQSGHVQALGTSKRLPSEDAAKALRYAPSALAARLASSANDSTSAGWITDFARALELGMALKLRGEEKVKIALTADWIICVGVRDRSDSGELERFLTDAVANGELEFLRQDVPTNSTHGSPAAYELEPRDPVVALSKASFAERRQAEKGATDADRLAAALGTRADLLYRAPGAGLREIDAAGDMMRVLLPGLLDVLFQWLPTDLDRDTLVEFLVATSSARGTLPALRVRRNPYGILPVVSLDSLEPAPNASAEVRRAFEFARIVGQSALEGSASRVARVPVVEPGESGTAGKLEAILRLAPVGQRVDVNQLGSDPDTSKRIGCPYVEGAESRPADYLADLAQQPLTQLPDPTEADKLTPLLYRLARMSAELLRKELPAPLDSGSLAAAIGGQGIDTQTRRRLVQFVEALERLAERSGPELETLMIEVLDLLHHRGDAWLTALAYHRLQAQRESSPDGLQLGYYGFLGKIRRSSTTGGGDGYLQAPSITQATTVGLLRSAARRFRSSNAFQLNLSSHRVRLALRVLDGLRAGLNLRESLGMRGERYLHDREADGAIFALREEYPLPGATGDIIDSVPFDGLAVIERQGSDGLSLSLPLRVAVNDMKALLRGHLDAFSDLVIAEAVHQLAAGNAEAAGAWVRVLSGDPVPGDPEVVRTHRTGQASSHRVPVVLDPRSVRSKNPRSTCEPALARLASHELSAFSRARVEVTATATSLSTGNPVQRVKRYRLGRDLDLEPIDLVVGGESELVVRARAQMRTELQGNDEFFVESKARTLSERTRMLRDRVRIEVDLDFGATSASALLGAAARVRRLFRGGRPLAPDDIDAARLAVDVDEDALRAQLRRGLRTLQDRCERLADRLETLGTEVANAVTQVTESARNAAEVMRGDADAAARKEAFAGLRASRDVLDGLLRVVSRYGLPQALRLVTDHEIIVATGAYAEHVEGLLSRVNAKNEALRKVADPIPNDLPRHDLNATVERARHALQGACDGEALPIWLPFPAGSAPRPVLDGPHATLPDEIASWARLRPQLVPLRAWFAETAGAQVWRVEDQRRPFDSSDDLDPPDRPDDERPPSRHYATFVGPANTILDPSSNATRYAGFVVDEWSEVRASSIQHTALALNYDAPQSEPPHALLLGIPTSSAAWSGSLAAALVHDTIRLMQFRALSSRDAAFNQFTGRWFSVVPPKGRARRIPTRSLPTIDVLDLSVAVARVASRPPVHRTAAGLDERRRPGGGQ